MTVLIFLYSQGGASSGDSLTGFVLISLLEAFPTLSKVSLCHHIKAYVYIFNQDNTFPFFLILSVFTVLSFHFLFILPQ